jgi:hypothetical protein
MNVPALRACGLSRKEASKWLIASSSCCPAHSLSQPLITFELLELLGAVLDGDAGFSADELIIGALVSVLKPPPSTDIIDENRREIGGAVPDIKDQLLQ